MSKLNRQKQHRPSRDTAKSKELADLRRENHKLKQQVARTRKQATRAIDAHFPLFKEINRTSIPKPEMKGCVLSREVLLDAAEKMAEVPSGPPVRIVPPNNGCPECRCPTAMLQLGPKVAEVCTQCGWRRVVKPDPI